MKSIRLLDRRAGYSLASIGLLLGIVAPTALPAFASADVLTSRSIALSNATANADDVTYGVTFTPPNDIDGTGTPGGVVIYFCDDSPILGAACNPPSGLDTSSVTVAASYDGTPASSNGTVASPADNSVKWTAGADFTGGDTLELELGSIHNPTAVGTFYARITTYADATALASSAGTDATAPGTYQDEGSVALSTTNTVGVTAYVRESMSFCVSKGDIGKVGTPADFSTQAAPSYDCGSHEADCNPTGGVDPGCVVAPSMTLGKKVGTVQALDSSEVSTGGVYAQLSTNAATGAVVSLKSDATGCGGLYLNGDPGDCNIGPAASGLAAGTAGFGLLVGTPAAAPAVDGTGHAGSGDFDPDGSYNGSTFFIDYDDSDETGITSTYGSPLIHSTGIVDNMNIPITFGATISGNTPAGAYGADFNLIATGTF